MLRALWLAALAAGVASAAPRPPVVAGFERFHAGGSARGGRLLATELGCVNCHPAADKTLLVKQGPVLSDVGGRVRVGWLRKYLSDPHDAKPGATMPHVLAGDPEAKEKVEALVHLLASTAPVRHDRPKGIAAGRDLYSKVGCVACHGTRDAAGKQAMTVASSVPLGDLPAKYTLPGLTKFLQNPTHARPSGRMPKLLDEKQAGDVAGYLLQGQRMGVQGGTGTTAFRYYEGNFDKLPDFAKLKPAAEGIASGLELGAAGRTEDYALTFEGFFEVKKEGRFSFTATSDDGSRVFIDDRLVVDNDGTHAAQTKRSDVTLAAGVHKARVEFFQGGGGAELGVTVSGPGVKTRPFGEILSATEAAVGKPLVVRGAEGDDLTIDPALVEKGRGVFSTAGCANCHTLAVKGKAVEGSAKAPAFDKLAAGKGCLADEPKKGVPFYGLSEAQKRSLASAIGSLPAVKADREVIADTMTVFNCYACHGREKVGGPPAELDKAFQTTQPEMGDEGRLPPTLDGAGAKLREDYVQQILRDGAHHRPYMHTRMPGFGDAAKGGIVAALKAADRLPAVAEVKFDETTGKVKAAARHLTGGTALGCIKCHTFNGKKAEGVQGIDMTLMPRRLERDWFHAYVTDPQKIRPGTRMPASFIAGKSVLPNVLDGTARQQVEAMWVYLKDGPAAQAPAGMGGASIPLNPTTGAILYRNFIEGAGTRAIGVGYPEKAHLAFDANGLRLALLWHGDFINAGRHWTGRGEGYEGPAGDNVLKLPAGVSFAKLASADAAWPTDDARKLGYRFRGYDLDKDDRPRFNYTVGEVAVADFPNPAVAGKDVTMTRQFTFGAKPGGGEGLHFRAAVGNKIEAEAGGWFKVDGSWRVKAPGGKVRRSGGKDEVIVPVTLVTNRPGTAAIGSLVIEYSW